MQGFWSGLVQHVGHGANASNLAFFVLLVTVLAAPRLARLAHLPSLVALVLLGMAVGPHGFGLLATQQIALAALGEFGLLYLMFTAGLELDLKRFVQNKKAALGFAALSFSIPLALGIVSARLLGYAWAAAVLMGSNWSSHTLVTYPALRDMGLAHSRPVSIVVSATMLTDTSALLVLAAVSVSTRRNGSFFAEGAEVMIGLALLVVWSLMALPRIARWFFARSGADVTQRVLFSLVALCVGAVLAESAGIDGIVGAFFAGLGLGSTIPEKSPLMDRVRFLGRVPARSVLPGLGGRAAQSARDGEAEDTLVRIGVLVGRLGRQVAGRGVRRTRGAVQRSRSRRHERSLGLASRRHARDDVGRRKTRPVRLAHGSCGAGGHPRDARGDVRACER